MEFQRLLFIDRAQAEWLCVVRCLNHSAVALQHASMLPCPRPIDDHPLTVWSVSTSGPFLVAVTRTCLVGVWYVNMVVT